MSVSEKLKALETEWPKSRLDAALPQIVAVVEAAELMTRNPRTLAADVVLGAVLSALEEAL